jgi:hypothetical protein
VSALLGLADLLPSLAAGLQHPDDGVRDVAAYTTRRILLNLPPLYQELSAAPGHATSPAPGESLSVDA